MFLTLMLLDLQETLPFAAATFVPDIGFPIVIYKFWFFFFFGPLYVTWNATRILKIDAMFFVINSSKVDPFIPLLGICNFLLNYTGNELQQQHM